MLSNVDKYAAPALIAFLGLGIGTIWSAAANTLQELLFSSLLVSVFGASALAFFNLPFIALMMLAATAGGVYWGVQRAKRTAGSTSAQAQAEEAPRASGISHDPLAIEIEQAAEQDASVVLDFAQDTKSHAAQIQSSRM